MPSREIPEGAIAHGDDSLDLYAPSNTLLETGDMTVNGLAVDGIPGSSSSSPLLSGISWTAVAVDIDDGTLTIAGSGSCFSRLAGLQTVPEPSASLALESGLLWLGLVHRSCVRLRRECTSS